LKRERELPKLISHHSKRDANQSDYFVFCEKSSGLAQFQGSSSGDLDCTIERMASMLAMQCLVRGSEPADFAILVPAEKMFAHRLASRARELLDEGRAMANPASLSPRQKEILHSVLCNQANKEIASRLNITVRTVKFHISSLLSKFGAENRTELARRAAGTLRTTMSADQGLLSEYPGDVPAGPKLGPVGLDTTVSIASKGRSLRYPQRVLTA
jgi:DNA-binding CsgD family transcriptional regulator